jgi:dTDP-4-dehydrorhamnose reductase
LTEIRRVLVTGAQGQIGRELVATKPDGYELHACGHRDLDVSDAKAVDEWIASYRPSLVINAAGFTAVDRAESERDSAFRINCQAPGHLAESVARIGGRLIHISTDYVFGDTKSTPYRFNDIARPLSAYGESKLCGERRVLQVMGQRAMVIRTSWVYSSHGTNFVRTILRLMRDCKEIRVVSDQIGTPTWARGLAQAIWKAARRPELNGISHWTDAGVASWYDFAVAIQEEATALGLLSRAASIIPIRTEDYPLAAVRPAYSVLDKHDTWKALGYIPPHWRLALRSLLKEIAEEQVPRRG